MYWAKTNFNWKISLLSFSQMSWTRGSNVKYLQEADFFIAFLEWLDNSPENSDWIFLKCLYWFDACKRRHSFFSKRKNFENVSKLQFCLGYQDFFWLILSIKSSESTGLSTWSPAHHQHHHGAWPKEIAFHQQRPWRSIRSPQPLVSMPCYDQRRIQTLHYCCMNFKHP